MGFMDKAKAAAQDAAKKGKELADQAQTKLDEAQNNFNSGQGHSSGTSGSGVEYDKHGRPIATPDDHSTTPPQGDPLTEAAAPAPAEPEVRPDDQSTTPPSGDPLSEAPKPAKPPSDSSGMTSGDPLAG